MVGIVIQARMGSNRLPGKVLEPVGGRPLLGLLTDRLKRCRRAKQVVVATGDGPANDPIAEWGVRDQVRVFRGSEEDVLGRYAACAGTLGLSIIVRATGDNPLTDPDGVDALIEALESGGAVYAHNKHPRGYPVGTGAEAITIGALRAAALAAREPYDREHVTQYVLRHPEQFPTRRLDAPAALQTTEAVFTVDYPEDVQLLRRLDEMAPLAESSLADVLRCVRANPDLAQINRHLHTEYGHAQPARDR